MKASELLALVKESSKGTKSVEGEVKTPSYDNMNTPDNHVAGKGTKEVTNAKKDFGKKRDKRNPANPGKPKKGEKRGMEGPGKSYKRMSEAAPGRPEGLPGAEDVHAKTLHHIAQSVQNLNMDKGMMVVAPDQVTARAMKVTPGQPISIQMDPEDLKSILQPGWQAMKRSRNAGEARQLWVRLLTQLTQASGMKQTAPKGRKDTAPNVYKGATPEAPSWELQDSIGESYADSNSMSKDQPVKHRGAVSKTAKVRGKVNDEPENKADPGKPKNDGKSVMGPGASPEKAKEIHERSKFPDPYGSPGKKTKPYSTGKMNVKPEDFQKKKKKKKAVEEGIKDLEKLLGRKLKIK